MVKDPIMKIKKKAKSKTEFHDMSGKNVFNSNGEAKDEHVIPSDNMSNGESVKSHKKLKKEKMGLDESEQPVKKPKKELTKEQIKLNNEPHANNITPKVSQNGDIVEDQGDAPINGVRSNTKDTLVARLRIGSTHFKDVLSILHIPRHKNADGNDSGDDEVADITPEVRRQMKMKVQAQIKSQPRAQNRAELQERLRLKLVELRGSDKPNSKGKNKNKKKLTKAEKRSKAKQEKKLKAKLARGEQKGNSVKAPAGAKPAKPVYNNDGKMVFSKFDFTNGECAIGGGTTKKPALDPKAALGKIQKHKEKIQSLQAIGKTERAKNLEEKATWKSVMERTEGVKVKDDEGLLKKTIKRMDQKKKSSKKKWESRVDGEETRKKEKQEKRSGNIKKRKQDKKENKSKKASKKGRAIPGFR